MTKIKTKWRRDLRCRPTVWNVAPTSEAGMSEGKHDGVLSCCSVQFLSEKLAKLKLMMKVAHVRALEAAPFAHFLDLHEYGQLNLAFMRALVNRFDP